VKFRQQTSFLQRVAESAGRSLKWNGGKWSAGRQTQRPYYKQAAMNPSEVLLLSFLVGGVSGLRALTAPAVVAWAARLNWLNLHDTPLSFMGSGAAVAIFTLLAAAELVVDQLPSTPSRLQARGLTARIVLGGLSGASLAAAGAQSLALGAVLGLIGGILGALAGYQVRTRLVKALNVPDLVIAVGEDAVAIAAGLFIVSRL
jgi:uncharacterized membrane protein